MTTRLSPLHGLRGFTLLELIIVIAITAVVGAMVAVFVTGPVLGYTDLARRAGLVDAAESALRRMARDIRLAVPNSVRILTVGSGFALELVPVLDGGRYATAETTCDNLTGFDGAADTQFDLLGTFATLDLAGIANYRLVINNQGDSTSHDIYADAVSGAGQRVITAAGITVSVSCGTNQRIAFASHQFRSDSPRDRVFVVTTPVTYLCEPSASGGTLTRYEGYTFAALQADRDTNAELTGAGATGSLIADKLTACTATSLTADVRDRGLVTLALTLAEKSETIQLTHQVQVDNSR
jgi:MSHA biogenesis protein MshO